MSKVGARTWRLGWAAVLAAALVPASTTAPAQTTATSPSALLPAPPPDESRRALELIVARLIHRAIPLEYDKQKDWGATAEIPVGVRVAGKPFHWHASRRTKTVNHGVWKHYRVRILDPQKDLAVTIANLRPLGAGRSAATLQIDAKIDVWARAKVYQHGVHLIALELEGDTRVRLIIDGELGVRFQATDGVPGLALDPKATNSRVVLEDFHIRRVSDAKGPLVRELTGSVRNMLDEELRETELTAKINRAIDKKRDRLALSPSEYLAGSWRPLAASSASSAEAVSPPVPVAQP